VSLRLALLPVTLAVALSVLVSGCSSGEENATTSEGTEAPTTPVGGNASDCGPGTHSFTLPNGRLGRMRVTAGGRGGAKALIVVLHGAGGSAIDGLRAFRGGWSAPGLVLVAPASRGASWSILRGPDRDIDSVNVALTRALARCRVDPGRIAIGGFSDGATYALSLGLSNGDLYRSVVALSPGGITGGAPLGRPRVFVSHGEQDSILPISSTSDRIVPALRAAGYPVVYRRFQGGHEVPEAVAKEAVRWVLAG
jgi:predicted esterase